MKDSMQTQMKQIEMAHRLQMEVLQIAFAEVRLFVLLVVFVVVIVFELLVEIVFVVSAMVGIVLHAVAALVGMAGIVVGILLSVGLLPECLAVWVQVHKMLVFELICQIELQQWMWRYCLKIAFVVAHQVQFAMKMGFACSQKQSVAGWLKCFPPCPEPSGSSRWRQTKSVESGSQPLAEIWWPAGRLKRTDRRSCQEGRHWQG